MHAWRAATRAKATPDPAGSTPPHRAAPRANRGVSGASVASGRSGRSGWSGGATGSFKGHSSPRPRGAWSHRAGNDTRSVSGFSAVTAFSTPPPKSRAHPPAVAAGKREEEEKKEVVAAGNGRVVAGTSHLISVAPGPAVPARVTTAPTSPLCAPDLLDPGHKSLLFVRDFSAIRHYLVKLIQYSPATLTRHALFDLDGTLCHSVGPSLHTARADGLELCTLAQREGSSIHVVTARASTMRDTTRTLLQDLRVPSTNLVMWKGRPAESRAAKDVVTFKDDARAWIHGKYIGGMSTRQTRALGVVTVGDHVWDVVNMVELRAVAHHNNMSFENMRVWLDAMRRAGWYTLMCGYSATFKLGIVLPRLYPHGDEE